MPLALSAKEYDALWIEAAPSRRDMEKRNAYYIGKHAILSTNQRYADGTQKSTRVANWVRYIVDMYVGMLTATPYQISDQGEKDEGNPGPAQYRIIADANDLARLDAKHLRSSLIKGSSVEVHGWNVDAPGQHSVQAQDPLEWYFALDEFNATVAAVRKVTVPKGTIRNGAPLDTPVNILTAYDDQVMRTFEQAQKANTDWVQTAETPHYFSRVPVVRWRMNDEHASYVTDALIGLCDEYNEIFSTAGDDIRRTVDALLAISGHDPKWVIDHAKDIMENRILPLGESGSAAFLMRSSDTAPIQEQLKRTREVINVEGQVPDIQTIVGATGATSGIALQLQFMPMIRTGQAMIPYIKSGLRERIVLINDRLAMTSKPKIEAIEITVQVALPVNRVEEWQNIGALHGIVSHRKQLELMSDISDPDQELRRLEREAEAKAGIINTPEQAAVVMDARVEKQAVTAQSDFQSLVANLSTALTDHMLQSGAFDRLVKANA